MAITEATAQLQERNLQVSEETRDSVQALNKNFSDYFKSLKQQAGDKLEAEREKGNVPTGEMFTSAVDSAKGLMENGVLGFLATITAAISGLAVGVALGLASYLAALAKTFNNLTGGRITKAMSALARSIRGGFFRMVGLGVDGKPVAGTSRFVKGLYAFGKNPFGSFMNLVRSIRGGFFRVLGLGVDGKPVVGTNKLVKTLSRTGQTVSSGISRIGSFFQGVRTALEPMTKLFASSGKSIGGGIKSAFSTFKNFISGFTKSFGAIRGLMSPIFTLFKTVGRVIFAPITLIMSIIDSVKGAIEGFKQEGFLGGILGAIGGLAGGLIGMPLDLLKSAIGWVAGALGFDNFKEMLANFSFKDLIFKMFMKIANIANGIFDDLFGGFKDGFFVGMKQMLGTIGKYVFRMLKFFPAVVAGGVHALAALLPGGLSPKEAFVKTFNKVLKFGEGGDAEPAEAELVDADGNELKVEDAGTPKKKRLSRSERRRQRREELEERRKQTEVAKESGGNTMVNAPQTTIDNSSSNTTVMTGGMEPAVDGNNGGLNRVAS